MQSIETMLPTWFERALLAPVETSRECSSTSELTSYLARADASIELYRLDEARQVAASIAEHPDRHQPEFRCYVLSLSARLLLSSGKVAEGFRRYQEALNCGTTSAATIHLQWARALEMFGNYPDALQSYLAALQLLTAKDQVGVVHVHSGVARIQQFLGDFESAHQTLQHVLEQSLDPALRYIAETTRAGLLVAQGNARDAIELLDRIRSSGAPTSYMLQTTIQELLLLRSHIQLHRWDLAGSLAEALGTRAEEFDLSYCAAEACYLSGRIFSDSASPYYSPPLAIEQFKRALKHTERFAFCPLHSQIHFELATLYRSIGHHRNAYQHLERFSAFATSSLSVEALHRSKQIEIRLATESLRHELRHWQQRHASTEAALEDALRTIETYKQRLDEQIAHLGVVAHDLKNPLAAILMSTSILDRYGDRLSKEDRTKHLTNIIQTTEWMKGLIISLLDFAALSTGRLKLTIEPIHCALLMDTVIETYRLRALAKSLTIHKLYASEELFVLADSQRLQECLDNLLSNAIKYSPLGRNIYCSIEQRSERVRLSIRDEGPGLTAEEQQRLFREFSRARSRDTGNEGGTGLGLSIVRRFVEAMNGTIDCESTPGHGSTFFIELPVAPTSITQSSNGAVSRTDAPHQLQVH